MKHVLSLLKSYRKQSILAPLFKMLEAVFELFVPLVVAAVIDRGISGQNNPFIIKMSLILILLAVIGLTCSITAQYFAAKAAVGTASGLRQLLFKHIQSLSFTQLDTLGTSTLITRMTSDINQVQNGINMVLRLFLRSPFIVFGAMIMAFTINVSAALVFVVIIPVLSIVVFGIMMMTRPLYKRVQYALDRILGITRENLTGVRVIRAFHKEKKELHQFEQANDDVRGFQKFAGKISGLMNPITYIIINAGIVVLIWTGAIKVNAGSLTQGEVVALYNYMSQILVELIKLANLIITITKALACANRIEEVFSVEVVKEEKQDIALKEKESDDFAVEFSQVGLHYEGAGAEALSDITFKVKHGETVGIIGGTGSGKSSLVHLIPGFYSATSGEVLVDGINVNKYEPSKLRDKVAVVMQKAQLFQGTIESNLKMGNIQATDKEIEMALSVSQSNEFVSQKENGLQSEVEQNGRNLSGGQKQRLTIARALVKKSEILILDDSSSALDYATDARLRKALGELSKQLTVFIVSQRAASIMHCSQIIVLDDGKIVGTGTHDSLLNTCEVYREIYDSQFRKEA